MTLLDLVRAEVTKARSAPFVRGLLFLSAVLPLVLMLILAQAMSTDQDRLLRWPLSALSVEGFFPLVSVVVPATLLAWLVGIEQTGDTWKLILVRRPTRVGFLIAKLIVAGAVSACFFLFTIAFWLAGHELVGLLIGQEPTPAADRVIDRVIVGVVGACLTSAIITGLSLLGAVLVPKNGVVVGAMSGCLSVMVANIVDTKDGPLITFVRPVDWAAARLLGFELPEPLQDLDPTRCALVLLVWLVVPPALALVVFARRDVESGAG